MPLKAERQRHFDESPDITDVIQDYLNLFKFLEFPVSSDHLPPPYADGLVTSTTTTTK